MNITVLGAGSWGFALAILLANKGFHVTLWTTKEPLYQALSQGQPHPFFPDVIIPATLTCTVDLDEATTDKDLIIESVTASGIRDVFSKLSQPPKCPIVITSKGIEQSTGLILTDVLVNIFGESVKGHLTLLSGPSFAQEVIHGKPTSVVAASLNLDTAHLVCQAFRTASFRVYPNQDIVGVAYGGALKNVIAIACGISDALELGASARAALMTRGLHEIRKLAILNGARGETIGGLAGMGDLIVTCSSSMSRNYQFGWALAKGKSAAEAKASIGHVVEGAFTTAAVYKLSHSLAVPMPINEVVYQVIYQELPALMGVQKLMQREVKEEHL